MFRSEKPVNYEDVYESLRKELAKADFRHAVQFLGARDLDGRVAIDAFGRACLAGPEGIFSGDGEPLPFTIRICLAYYLLQAGNGKITGRWVSYRDFRDGAFFHSAYAQTVENRIASEFAGRIPALEERAGQLGGTPLEEDYGGDLRLVFPALPKVPMGLVFYDADEEFPASAKVLYDESAPQYLDMECLAVMGMILADRLASKKPIG